MIIKLFNTLTRKKEVFKPLHTKKVGFYACGPTVYNYAHIGNLRTYIFEDILRRTLEYAGYKIRHIMNITDVEDKIIKEANLTNQTIFEFTIPYEKAFFDDLAKLNIKKAAKYPKATEHIKEMIKIIKNLLKNGFAYILDESVFFDISKFKNYGKLSKINLKCLKTGTRALNDEYTKENIQDFVLWKAKKDSEPFWDTPFGQGRPGWHIECSAMSAKYLGQPFDIHAGAVDLIFPHHENEIAQSEGALKKQFAKYFIHGEHLLVNGEKMSKSLGNIFTLRDFTKKNINPLALRYLILTAHYRSKLNFTWESLHAAENSLNRIYDFIQKLKSEKINSATRACLAVAEQKRDTAKFKNEFEKAIYDDLNTPKALAIMWKIISAYNKNPQKFNPTEILNLLMEFDKIFGLNLKKIKIERTPKEINILVKQREKARKNKDFEEADKIREKLREIGWTIEDTAEGTKIIKN